VPKSLRFTWMAVGTAAIIAVVDPVLRTQFEPLTRYFIYYLLSKVITDGIYYVLAPRRRVWQYVEDYIVHEVLTLSMWAIPLVIAQRYLILVGLIPNRVVMAVLDSWLFVLVLCLRTRWTQEEADDKTYRPGRRLERNR